MTGKTNRDPYTSAIAESASAKNAALRGTTTGRVARLAGRMMARAILRIRATAANESGEGFVDVLVKMLVVVVVGAALLGIMKAAVPQLFQDMITKIREVFVVT